MQRLTLDEPIAEPFRGAIVALGNFDGFHLGHQAVVGRAVARGAHEGKRVIVATFDPHPVRHFRPDAPPFRLTTLNQRERMFAAAGADAMLVFAFNAELAATSAERFVGELLGQRIGASGVVTGSDFTFGAGRSGNAETLRELGAAHGIDAETVSPILLDGEPVSSSRIREALKAGRPGQRHSPAHAPLRNRGRRRSRRQARPRAWLADRQCRTRQLPAPRLRDLRGARAPRRRKRNMQGWRTLASGRCSIRPRELLEAVLFDFDGDLYGRTIEVALHHYLRPEMKFDGLPALKARMDEDAAEARQLLAAPAPLA